jgi:hypothetical protein
VHRHNLFYIKLLQFFQTKNVLRGLGKGCARTDDDDDILIHQYTWNVVRGKEEIGIINRLLFV